MHTYTGVIGSIILTSHTACHTRRGAVEKKPALPESHRYLEEFGRLGRCSDGGSRAKAVACPHLRPWAGVRD